MSEYEDKYADMVLRLAKPGADILKQLTAADCHILHMVWGICGEAGELLDAVKKRVVYRKDLDVENVIEELGDLEFYMQGLRRALDISRKRCLEANTKKLETRYAEAKYTDAQAQERKDKQIPVEPADTKVEEFRAKQKARLTFLDNLTRLGRAGRLHLLRMESTEELEFLYGMCDNEGLRIDIDNVTREK